MDFWTRRREILKSRIIAACVSMILWFTGCLPTYASSHDHSSLHQLLQQHLTLVEVERDMSRLKKEQLRLKQQVGDLQLKLNEQQVKLDNQRIKVGEIVRAYYVGERPSLWIALLSAKDWHEFFLIFDFLTAIYERDRDVLVQFAEQFRSIEILKGDLQSLQGTVNQTIAHYQSQFTRLNQLNLQLEGQLSRLPDDEKIRLLMKQLENDWLQQGLPTFERYFYQLSLSMQDLPEMIDTTKMKKSGSKLTVTLSDQELNRFLASKHRMFQATRFTFRNQEMWIEGIHDGAALTIIGHYQLISDKAMHFVIDKLIYDGYALPDSTKSQLSTKFNLGFYPTQIHPNVRIKGVEMIDHELHIQISFSLTK
jgi:peptidoglycan hydrolase CwlO-like protein